MQIIQSAVQSLLIKLSPEINAADLFKAGAASGSAFRSAAIVAEDAGTFVGSGLSRQTTEYQWHPVIPMAGTRGMHPPAGLTALKLAPGVAADHPQLHMLEVEASQLVMSSPQLANIVGDADVATDTFAGKRKALVDALRTSPQVSDTLRAFLDGVAPRL